MLPGQLEPVVAAGLPAVVAIALAGMQRVLRPPTAGSSGGWVGALLCLGFTATLFLLRGWPGFPPANVDDWALFLSAAAVVVVITGNRSLTSRSTITLGYIVVALPLLLKVAILRQWSFKEAALLLPAFALGWLGLILAARTTAERLPDLALPAWAAALGFAGYIIADRAHGIQHGQLVAGAGAAAGALALARMLWPERIRPTAIVLTLAAVVPLWWLLAYELDTLPASALAPFAAAPLAAWISWPLRQRRWTAAIVAALAAILVNLVALWLVNAGQPPDAGTVSW